MMYSLDGSCASQKDAVTAIGGITTQKMRGKCN